MRLEEDELVFYDYEWTIYNNVVSDDIQYVSPFFGLDISPHIREANAFRFAIRLIKMEIQVKAVVYLYVHFLDTLGVGVTDIECFIEKKPIKLLATFRDSQTLIFESREFRATECLNEDKFYLNFRIYPSNVSSGYTFDCLPIGDYGFQQFDIQFGEDMWSAACKKLLTDCEFLVNDTVFHAHRAIVASRCPTLIDWHSLSLSNKWQITVFDINDTVFEAFLYYIYTGQIMPIDPDMYRALANLIIKHVRRNADDLHESNQPLDEPSFSVEPAIKISENHGIITFLRRGVSIERSYKSHFKLWEKPESETILINNKGTFHVGLKKLVTRTDESECEISVCNTKPVNGLDLIDVAYYRPGSKSHLAISSKDQQFRGVLNVPKNQRTSKNKKLPQDSKSPKYEILESIEYLVLTELEMCLTEVYDSWGYRLRDLLLPGHIWSFYDTKEWVDIELRMGDNIFFAHQAILSARSPVFAATFNVSEKITAINIEQVNPFVFEEFLYFLYTGTLRTLENMKGLHSIAKKYGVKTLEEISQSV